jgi:hypothetical protein
VEQDEEEEEEEAEEEVERSPVKGKAGLSKEARVGR